MIITPKNKYPPALLFKHDNMNSEKVGMIIGIFLLVLGIAVLLFVFTQALALVQNPGAFFEEQFPQEEEEEAQGPNAQFSWSTNDFTVQFQDESEMCGRNRSISRRDVHAAGHTA